jgi:hypothetical protein
LVHILLSAFQLSNSISCKIVSYLLSISSRSTYWITSWIALERFLIVLYPTSLRINNPRTAGYLIIGTLVFICIMHTHELVYTTSIYQAPTLVCVTNFDTTFVSAYNRISTLAHHLIPSSIQIVSTTLLLVLAARSRSRTTTRTTFAQLLRKQFSTQKELYLTPLVIILSALPQAILSFTLACTQLSHWQKYFLLIAVTFSYTPQALGFILHVLPSSGYRKEFFGSSLGKKLFN